MKKFRKIALAVGAFYALTLATATPTLARDSFAFSFNTGDVAFAYSDGYWDRDHHWHGWRNSHERSQYRDQYAQNYKASRHTREHNNGWREQDHDGTPNEHNHDRNGDGRSNNHDEAGNNRDRQ